MQLLPLLPGQHYRLRHGRARDPGEETGKVWTVYADGTRDWDRESYTHQSTRGLVHGLLSRIKSQGVWDKERAWVELTDEQNVGGRWLRDQVDPRATFEQMWATAFVTYPKLSFEQLVSVLVGRVAEHPGIRLAELRQVAFDGGWRNRGDLDSLLAGLVADGVFSEVRTAGPGGQRVTSRRFWKRAVSTVRVIAKSATAAVSIALRAASDPLAPVGQKNPEGGRSYWRLLTDRRLRMRGLQLLRARLRRLRPWRPRSTATMPPAAPQNRALTENELAQMRVELDLMEIDQSPSPGAVPMGAASWSLRCLL